MCNKFGYNSPLHRLIERFGEARLAFDDPPGFNAPPCEEINPTDPTLVVTGLPEVPRLRMMRWGFAPPRAKAPPAINFRSEGRTFDEGRCLVPATHFFEFTGRTYPKTRWRFTFPGEEPFCMAGLVRGAGEAARFTLLTLDAGPDVAPYHDRQIVPLPASAWAARLDPATPPGAILRPGPAGSLSVAPSPRELLPPGLALDR